jgi:hypothetical protein
MVLDIESQEYAIDQRDINAAPCIDPGFRVVIFPRSLAGILRFEPEIDGV